MNPAPRNRKEWLREHYEKMLLLLALIALLISSAWLVKDIQADKERAALSLARMGWRGHPVPIRDTVPFDAVLEDARSVAAAPLAVSPRTMVSEVRVSCVKCGRPIVYDAIECPFCLAEQPPIIDIETLDTDGDGIPDRVELDWGLNPQDKTDAAQDLDGDGFTNLEEYRAGTDPRDPESMPDPVIKMRVAGIRAVPFVLRYVGTQQMPGGSKRFLLNLQSLQRSYFAKLGDIVLGYKVETHDPQGKNGETLTLVRQSDQRPVVLVKGRPVTEQELAILFVSLLERRPLPVQRLNDVFVFHDVSYKVVDIRRDSVVIQKVETGEKVTIPQISGDERSAMTPSTPPAAAPAAAAGAGTGSPW
ncbi:MAG: Amuc_1099 family pilus-like system protein [Kiritimatiellia bacterium]|nr:Amuc_1099 family pilus-like system protein [Kiritimatiellia bacterium]